MSNIKNFLKSYKSPIIWTLCYVMLVFFILYGLFGFNIFSVTDWTKLAHARLHGFAGFAFGILLLSAIPMYIATIVLILRTKKALFNISFKKPPAKKTEEAKQEAKEEEIQMPQNMPAELRGAFLRAKSNILNIPISDFDMGNMNKQASINPQSIMPNTLPIPDSFDFSDTDTVNTTNPNAPIFKEISFNDSISQNNTTPSLDISDIATTSSTDPVANQMRSCGHNVSQDGDIVIANKMAIITHSDSDFWIADEEDWFAAGKQKRSPIATVTESAKKHTATPVIYLAEKNIMDLDNLIKKWESMGVKVITSLTEIN